MGRSSLTILRLQRTHWGREFVNTFTSSLDQFLDRRFTHRKGFAMRKRLGVIGIMLVVAGFIFAIAAGVAYVKVQDGYDSLQSFRAAQNVELSYDENGELIDRGTTEGAEAIMSLLVDDWNYPVVESDLDPNDPLVNTGSEYMFQMATIAYHVLHGTQTVVLDEAVEYDGETFEAGEYEVVVNEVGSPERVAAGLGGYWTDFDRMHPLEGPPRAPDPPSVSSNIRPPRDQLGGSL